MARHLATTAPPTPVADSPFAAWQSESVRLSLFFKDGLPDPRPSWKSLMGVDPETKMANSTEQTEQESGPCKGVPRSAFTLILYKKRIDFVLSYRPADEEKVIAPSIGSFENCLFFLKNLALSTPGNKRNVVRLAVGGAVVLPSIDNNDAHRKISRVIDRVEIDGDFEDFLLRINFPSESNIIPQAKINRLATWSAVRFGALSIGADLPTPTTVSTPYVQCVLDVNIALQSRPVPVGKVSALIDELLETAKSAIRVEQANE